MAIKPVKATTGMLIDKPCLPGTHNYIQHDLPAGSEIAAACAVFICTRCGRGITQNFALLLRGTKKFAGES